MTQPPQRQPLGFFTTPPHDCGYLPARKAVTMFVDPRMRPNNTSYTSLSEHGFRRSGGHIYRPKCPGCNACIPMRVPVAAFKPGRAHRRTLKRNADVTVSPVEAKYDAEHFALYCRYISARHAGGGMENPDPDSYMDFLTANWAKTSFLEFRAADELIAVAVVDHLDDALSAVYTFYDPAQHRRSLGTLAVLKEIELARNAHASWLYLGYWIKDCRKMSYKSEFAPYQTFENGVWSDQALESE